MDANIVGGDKFGGDKVGGDSFATEVGGDAQNVVVGKQNTQQIGGGNEVIVNVDQGVLQTILYQLNRIESTFGREIEFLKRDIADVNRDVTSVSEDVKMIRERQALVLEDVSEIKRDQYPRWFQILMIAMAILLIAIGLFLTTRVLALGRPSSTVGRVVTYQR